MLTAGNIKLGVYRIGYWGGIRSHGEHLLKPASYSSLVGAHELGASSARSRLSIPRMRKIGDLDIQNSIAIRDR
jgi:hypothetical protein